MKFVCKDCGEENEMTQEDFNDCKHHKEGICCLCYVNEQEKEFIKEFA